MRAGQRRHRVTIQERAVVQDPATGEISYAYSDWPQPGSRHWASIEPLSARDFVAAQAFQSEVTARIGLRYRPGLNSTMRVVYRDRIYTIHGVLPDPDSGVEYVTLPVSEGVRED